jgi:class 3 adenylate cyclase
MLNAMEIDGSDATVWALTSHQFEAVTGFVDLAGFTTAAEALGRSGPAGTEQLVSLINSLFSPAIDTIHSVGGEVGWFAGDAMGIVFDCAVTPPLAALHSLVAALRCIAEVQPLIVDGDLITMSAKVGVATGIVDWHWIGTDERVGWFGGDAIDGAAAAEHLATVGEVIADPSFIRLVPGLTGSPLAEGFMRLDQEAVLTLAYDEAASGATLRSPLLEIRRDPSFRPQRVARMSQTMGVESITDHRTVTAMFVAVPSPRHDSNGLARIRRIVEAQGGHINAATEGDKGASVLSVFGAPMAQPDRADRAVIAAAQVRDSFPTSRIGIASGRVFAGPIGTTERWDYATLGDRVNVAARLMQAAGEGEILIDQSTLSSMRRQLDLGSETLLALKGKSEPERATLVRGLGERAESVLLGATGSIFVGRARERDEIIDCLRGSDALVMIRGEAGSGKSRLLDRIIVSEHTDRFVVTWLEQADIDRPFGLWHRLVRRLCPTNGSIENVLLGVFPDAERLAILNAVLGVEFADSALTQNLGSRERLEIATSLLEELLPKLADGRSIAIEDLHWADDRSLELLRKLVPRLRRHVRLIATCRPEERTEMSITGASTITIEDLSADEVTVLIKERWKTSFGRSPDSALVESIALRSAGSPLFVEQIIALARDSGLAADARAWPEHLSFPLTVRDVVLSRLDRLPDSANTVAGWAAVIGRTFSSEALFAAFDELDHRTADDGLTGLIANGIVVTGELNHFHHALFAEASYDRLPFVRRRALHRSMLRYLESSVSDPATQASDFARHAQHGGTRRQQFQYFQAAADQAKAAYAGPVALRWYQLLLTSMVEDGTKTAAEIGAVHRLIGQVQAGTGDFKLAAESFAIAADGLSGGDRVDVLVERGEALARGGDAKSAYALFEQLDDEVTAIGDWPRLHRVLDVHANMATRLADVDRATNIERRCDELSGDQRTSALFENPLEGLTHLPRLRGDLATTEQRVRATCERALEVGDLARAALSTSSLAGLAFLSHRLGDAIAYLNHSADLFQTVGDYATMLQLVTCNAAQLIEAIGDSNAAVAGSATLMEAMRIGDVRIMAYGARLVGTAFQSESWLRRAVLLSEESRDRESVGEAIFWLARHQKHSAPELSRRLFTALSVIQPQNVLPQIDLIRLLRAMGQHSKEELSQLVQIQTGSRSSHDEALLFSLRAELVGDEEQVFQAAELCRAAFEQFPSAELHLAVKSLNGTEFHAPQIDVFDFSQIPIRPLADVAMDVDRHLDITSDDELRIRSDQVIESVVAEGLLKRAVAEG